MRYLEPVVNPGGEIHITGTRYHYDDLYGKLLDNEAYDVALRSAFNEDGSLFFAARLNEESLRQAEILLGSYVFSCQYLNNPVNPKDQVFKEHWLTACMRYGSPDPAKLRIVVYVDPAQSIGKRADYTAMACVGMDHKGEMWVLDMVRGKLLDDELVDRVYWLHDKWKPEAIGIEGNAAQKLYLKIFELEGDKRGHRLNVRPIIHSTRRDKEFRIRGLMPYIERGQIKIQPSMTQLLTEFRRYSIDSKEHDDQLDAIQSAVSMLSPSSWKEEMTFEQIKEEENRKVAHDEGYEKRIKGEGSFTDRFDTCFA
jgi:predicted phage terminase large subunit-like protein